MLALVSALFLCLFLHLSVLALVGTSLQVKLRELSYGYGPVVASWGRVQLKLFPLGGAVRFKDTRAEDLESWEREGTFDGQPLLVQLVVTLSGSLALLSVAFAIAPDQALFAFKDGFGQVVGGAERQLVQLARGLHQRGHLVRVAVFYRKGAFEADLVDPAGT